MKKNQKALKEQRKNPKKNELIDNLNKSLKAQLTMKLDFLDEKIAKSICDATSPENIETPTGTLANSQVDGTKILFEVKTTTRFSDLITTTEDFLEKVELARKTIELIENK